MRLFFLQTYILLFLIGCSTSTPAPQTLGSLAEADSYREPSSKSESCQELAADLLHGDKTSIEKAIYEPKSEPTLIQVLRERDQLKERYSLITESIRDFEIHPDLPVNAQTKLLLDPREGFLAKIMMIRNAKKTIDLSYFIFKEGSTSGALLHELRMAIKRGVKVRILVDSMGSLKEAPFHDHIKALVALSGRPILDSEGNPTGERAFAEAVLFNPIFNVRAHVINWFKRIQNLFTKSGSEVPLATFTINRRSHDKILLTDAYSETDSMAIMGGRNIADHYYAVGVGEEHPIRDAEVMIKGFVSRGEDGSLQNILEDHYNKIYFYLANKNFENFLFKTNRGKVRNEFRKMRTSHRLLLENEDAPLADLLKQMEADDFLNKDFENGLVSIVNEIQNLSKTKIFLDPNGPHNKVNGNSLLSKLRTYTDKAKKSIDIVSPYIRIEDEEVDFLMKWAAEDPSRKIRIFSNSISTTNNLMAQAMIDETFKKSVLEKIKNTPVENQFEIYAYGRLDDEALGGKQKYGLLHAKLAIIDEKTIMVSTSNLDPISRNLNSEVGLSIENLPANSKNIAQFKKYIDKLVKDSTLYGSPEWEEIRNHPANRIPIILEGFITKIIYYLNLVPLL
ncbi:MAG: phospholipase D-like domain-containing protein [Bacteriovorax sp.]